MYFWERQKGLSLWDVNDCKVLLYQSKEGQSTDLNKPVDTPYKYWTN